MKKITLFEATEKLYGDNTKDIVEVGSKYPVLSRTACMINSDYLLDLLKAIDLTADDVEERLHSIGTEDVEEPPVEEKKTRGRKPKKTEEVKEEAPADDDVVTYESMTTKELYKLCCDRGISSQCKSRSKDALIAILEKNDNKTEEPEPEAEEEAGDDWDTDDEKITDSYTGKSAKELFNLCKERGIKVKPKQPAEVYIEELKKDDAEQLKAANDEPEDDDDDEWEI